MKPIEVTAVSVNQVNKICKEKGANVLVAGSYIYGSSKKEYKKLIESLR